MSMNGSNASLNMFQANSTVAVLGSSFWNSFANLERSAFMLFVSPFVKRYHSRFLFVSS